MRPASFPSRSARKSTWFASTMVQSPRPSPDSLLVTPRPHVAGPLAVVVEAMVRSTNFLLGAHSTSGVADVSLITGAVQPAETATEDGADPAANGDPVMDASAPVVASIVCPETELAPAFVT